MDQFLNLVISGLVTGAIYSIMASGIVLTYQTSGIFNFSHGAVAFVCAYVYYQLHVGNDMPIVPALIISVFIFAPLLGLLLDKVLLRSLATAPIYARIIGTIGLLVALPALAQWLVEAVGNGLIGTDLPLVSQVVGAGGTVPGVGPTPPHVFRLGWAGLSNVNINSDQLAVFVVAALAAFMLWFVIRHTRVGLEMRASVDRSSLATLRGVSTGRSSAVAWVMTMLLAGLGGVLIGPLFPLNDNIFTLVVFGSLAAVALSGLRSIPIAFAGGLALGVIQNLIAGYGDDFLPGFLKNLDGFRAAVPFILTLIILVIAGRDRGRAGGSIADEKPPPDHRDGLSVWRRRVPWVIATLALVAFTMQWIDVPALQADTYEQGIIAKGMVFAVIFLSFVVVTGIGGMVSLSQATFVIAGGFMAGWAVNFDWGMDIPLVATHGQLNWLWAVVLAGLVGAAAGAVVALPVRRLGAVALALGTFALAFTADLVIFTQEGISNGSNGWFVRWPTLDLPLLPRYDFAFSEQRFVLFLIIFGLGTLMIHALMRSSTGREMLAVRSSEVAARASGIRPARPQILIFALSAGIAGLGGALLAMNDGTISNLSAPPVIGLVWIAVAVTFGIRRPGGVLLAGLAFGGGSQLVFNWIGNDFLTGGLHDLITSPYFTTMLFGLGAINLAQNPDGLLAIIGTKKAEKRREKERRAHVVAAEAELHGDEQAVSDALEGRVDEAEQAVHSDEAAASRAHQLGIAPTDGEVTTTASEHAVLWLDDIVAGYGAVEVLHGASITIQPGEVVALLGANGAGKSTLCSVAAGLVAPTSGHVVLDGTIVDAEPAEHRARAGMLLIPEARGIFPGLTVEENLKVLLRDADERKAATERFPILGERLGQHAGLLSGGEQQMLSLAPALARPPLVLIADEPTLGLSPLASAAVLDALRELRDRGCAILLVAEKAHEVMELADTMVFMELGRIVWSGPRDAADVDLLRPRPTWGSPDVHDQPANDGAATDVALTEPQLQLDRITVRFGGITALDGVTFDARAGEVLGIIGPNGAGKTTLFDVISGVRAPNDGSVILGGRNLNRVSDSGRARLGLRRTFQRVQTFGWLSVEDNVLSALEWRGGGGGFVADLIYSPTRRHHERVRRARVGEVLERCGLLAVRKELAGSLPIGIARMVEFARAIADPPKVLLLDEPASGLDETEITRLGTEIQTIRAESGCAVLLVEHNAGFVMEQSDRVVVLNLGQVLASGSPSEVQRNQAVRDAYLGESDVHAGASDDPGPRDEDAEGADHGPGLD